MKAERPELIGLPVSLTHSPSREGGVVPSGVVGVVGMGVMAVTPMSISGWLWRKKTKNKKRWEKIPREVTMEIPQRADGIHHGHAFSSKTQPERLATHAI